MMIRGVNHGIRGLPMYICTRFKGCERTGGLHITAGVCRVGKTVAHVKMMIHMVDSVYKRETERKVKESKRRKNEGRGGALRARSKEPTRNRYERKEKKREEKKIVPRFGRVISQECSIQGVFRAPHLLLHHR